MPRDERDRRAAGRDGRAAAGRFEARVADRAALDADRDDAHEVAARRAARRPRAEGARGLAAAADGMAQVLREALVGHA